MATNALTVGIYGLGLIGGSVALALRKARPDARVIGYGRNAEKLARALKTGLIDQAASPSDTVTAHLDIFLIATPADTVGPVFEDFQRFLPGSVIVMDAASVKETVQESVKLVNHRGLTFVAAHPMAGSEKTGHEAAQADLFTGKVVAITGEYPGGILERARSFWEMLGARVVVLSAGDHDKTVALTSHLPHLVASALVSFLSRCDGADSFFRGVYGRGLLDTTRIAQGDPAMWSGIVLANSGAVSDALENFSSELAVLQGLVRSGDRDGLVRYLEKGKSFREKI